MDTALHVVHGLLICFFREKFECIETFLAFPQSGGNIIGCADKKCWWDLKGFPNASIVAA